MSRSPNVSAMCWLHLCKCYLHPIYLNETVYANSLLATILTRNRLRDMRRSAGQQILPLVCGDFESVKSPNGNRLQFATNSVSTGFGMKSIMNISADEFHTSLGMVQTQGAQGGPPTWVSILQCLYPLIIDCHRYESRYCKSNKQYSTKT